MIYKILRLFVNTLTADDKYSLLNSDNLTLQTHMHLSQKQKTFSGFFFAFFKARLNFESFQKKLDLIIDVFLILRTPKTEVR